MEKIKGMIYRQDAIDALCDNCDNVQAVCPHYPCKQYTAIDALSPAQPEQKAEELLPDGTLHLFTDTDLSKVNRVLVSQNGTHYGDLYYPDEWRWLV